MRIDKFLLFYILCFSIFVEIKAQDERIKCIGIEAGTQSIVVDATVMDYVRKVSNYSLFNDESLVNELCARFYGGVKVAIFSKNNQWSLSGGLRYSHFYQKFNKNNNNDEYFYFFTKQNENSIEYLRIKNLKENIDYIGIPVELRFIPQKNPKFCRFIIIAGANINFLIKDKKDVVFYNQNMYKYKDEVIDKIEDPCKFFATLYLGPGFKFGKNNRPTVSINAIFPCFYLYKGSFGLMNIKNINVGLQIDVEIPFKMIIK